MWGKKLMVMILTFTMLIVTFKLNINPVASQETAQPIISIKPSYMQIGEEGLNLSEVAPFTVNVVLENVENLFAWQVRMYLNPRILNLTEVKEPETDYIFEGLDRVGFLTLIETRLVLMRNNTAINFENPVGTKLWILEKSGTTTNYETVAEKVEVNVTKWIDADGNGILSLSDVIYLEASRYMPRFIEYYYVTGISKEKSPEGLTIRLEAGCTTILIGDSLKGGQSYSGNGTLADITFRAIRPGICNLNFSRLIDQTFLLNPEGEDIEYNLQDGIIEVKGIPLEKDKSRITINVPSPIKVGSIVTIYGEIDPPREGVTVKIEYKPPGEDWQLLDTATTDKFGRYSYNWNASKLGTYLFRARWDGDYEYEGAVSEEITVYVTETGEAPPEEGFGLGGYLTYIVIAVVLVVIIAVAVYVLKVKKSKK